MKLLSAVYVVMLSCKHLNRFKRRYAWIINSISLAAGMSANFVATSTHVWPKFRPPFYVAKPRHKKEDVVNIVNTESRVVNVIKII